MADHDVTEGFPMRTAYLALAAALALTAAPAMAAVHFTLTGVVTSGSDNGYVFPGFEAPFGSPSYAINPDTGEAFGSATGRAFTLTLTMDTSRGLREDYPNSRVYYGSDADSPGKAVFTMNGISYEFGSASENTAFSGLEKNNAPVQDSFGGSFTSTRLRPAMNGNFTQIEASLIFGLSLPANTFTTTAFEEPFTFSGTPLGQNGRLEITLRNTEGFTDRYVTGPPRVANLRLSFNSLSATVDAVTTPAAVPEPSSWAIMILGFGVVGAAARRRPRTAVGGAV